MDDAHAWTVQQWQDYIHGLSPDDLWDKAKAANTWSFCCRLRETGLAGEEVRQVLCAFADRMRELKVAPPLGGYLDYKGMQSC